MNRYLFVCIIIALPIFQTQIWSQYELKLSRIAAFSSSDNITDLMFDDQMNLWIASKGGIYSIGHSDQDASKEIDAANAVAVKKNSNGDIYAGFKDNSIYVNNEMIFKIQDPNIVIKDVEVYNRKIWFGTNDGLFVFNQDTKQLEKTLTTRNSKLKTNKINFLYSDASDVMWIGTDKGVIRVVGDKWSKIYEQNKKMLAITEYFSEDHVPIVWLISDQEMWEIESKKNRWYPAALKKGLYEGDINDLVIDKDGNLFIASDVLIKFNPQSNMIEKYGESLGLVSKKCLALECNKENHLFIGTENAGLFKISNEEIKVDDISVLAILENPINCPGGNDGSLVLEVSGGQAPLEYLWSPAYVRGTNPQNLKKGAYSVTVVDAFNNQVVKSIVIEEPSPMTINVLSKERISGPGKKDGSCEIEVKGGNRPFKIKWDNKEKGAFAKKLNYGIHTIDVTDANGCKTSATIEIEKEKFIPELDIANIKIGQTLRINKLFFEADSTDFNDESKDVLDEIFDFMYEHETVSIEIGGHTNGIPPHKYCDNLSSSRAQNVAQYLISRGIKMGRITHKGYGKRKPISTNETISGRTRNQRVEIKILEFSK